MVLFCFVGPFFYHTNQINAQVALLNSTQNTAPATGHPLGTDSTGFDILGRIMFGGKNSLIVGFAAAVAATLFGVVYGAVSGFFGGWVDAVMMRFVDVLLSIPQLFLLIVLAVIFQPVAVLADLRHRLRGLARARPAHPGRDPDPAGPRVRPGRQGHGRQPVADRVPPHHPQHCRHDRRERHLPGGRRHPAARRTSASSGSGSRRPRPTGARCSQRRVSYAGNGYWWLIYPAGLCIVLVVVAFNFVGDALRDSLEVRLQRR